MYSLIRTLEVGGCWVGLEEGQHTMACASSPPYILVLYRLRTKKVRRSRRLRGRLIGNKGHVWSTKPEILTIWPFTAQVSWPLVWGFDQLVKDSLCRSPWTLVSSALLDHCPSSKHLVHRSLAKEGTELSFKCFSFIRREIFSRRLQQTSPQFPLAGSQSQGLAAWEAGKGSVGDSLVRGPPCHQEAGGCAGLLGWQLPASTRWESSTSLELFAETPPLQG